MAIGERIRFLRNLRGMTQKYLGMAVGFDKKNADIRMAQYESGKRTPKENLVDSLASVLEVSPKALAVPDIDTYVGLMHTLFTLEDLYGLKISSNNGQVCLTVDKANHSMFDMLNTWRQEADKLNGGEIAKEEYDNWRYNYPRWEAERFKALSDSHRSEKKQEGE